MWYTIVTTVENLNMLLQDSMTNQRLEDSLSLSVTIRVPSTTPGTCNLLAIFVHWYNITM